MSELRVPSYPTESAIRTALIVRVHAFCRLTGISVTAVGKGALNDAKFLARVEAGENFTVQTYQRVHDYIDAQLDRHADKARDLLRAVNQASAR